MKKILLALSFLVILTGNSWASNLTDEKPCLYCYTPYYFNANVVKATYAVLAFDGYIQTGVYELEYGPTGFVVGSGTKVTTSKLELTITGLQPNTEYTAYIRYKCSSGETSTDLPLTFKTTQKVDVGVSRVLTPISKCDLGENERLTVEVKNYGELAQSLIDLRFSVNGQPVPVPEFVDGYYTGVLSTDSTDAFLFDTGYDYTEEGEYKIASWTELEGDQNINNDTAYYTLFHVPTIDQLPYAQDFEANTGGWTPRIEKGTTEWTFGKPTGTIVNTTGGGENSFFINLPSNYAESVLSYLESPCYDFSNSTSDPYISFNLNFYDDSYYNAFYLETSIDGGENWTSVGTFGDALNWYNVQFNYFGFPAWGGTSNGWNVAGHNLPGLKGHANCRIRFVMNTLYNFTANSSVAVDNIILYNQIDKDITAATIKNTTTSECGSDKDKLLFTMVNTGNKSIVGQNQISAFYSVNNQTPVEEKIAAIVLLPGDLYTYSFKTAFNSFGPGTYYIKAWAKTVNDVNTFNDTTYYTLVIAEPASLPVVEDFEKLVVPQGWSVSGFYISNTHNNKSYVMGGNMYQFSVPEINITSSSLGPLDGSNTLTFDYRYVNYFEGTVATPAADVHLELELSDDCGESFQSILTIDKDNHVESVEMKNISVDLSAYEGKVIKLRFVATYTGTGDYWVDIDNININGCPANFGLNPEIQYVGGTSSFGSIKVAPTKGTAPYTYLWSNGLTTSTIINLAAGNYCVTVTDGEGCSAVTCYDVNNCPSTLGFNGSVTTITEPGKKDGKISLSGPSGNFTYAWSNGATGKSVSFLEEGHYTVTVTNGFGCQQILDFNVSTVGVKEIESLSQLNVTPNPTSSVIALNAQFTKNLNVDVKLLNVYGELLYTNNFNNITNINQTIDLSAFPAGIYVLQLGAENQISTKKIVKIQ